MIRSPCRPVQNHVACRAITHASMASTISRALSRSIEYGLEHRDEALDHALRYARGLDRERADRFVGMYVNAWTRGYGETGRRAVQTLLDRAHEAGLTPKVTAEYVDETVGGRR